MVFDYNNYISNNGDIKAAFGNDLKSYYIHYMTNEKQKEELLSGMLTSNLKEVGERA